MSAKSPKGSFFKKGLGANFAPTYLCMYMAPRRQQSESQCWLGANFSVGMKIRLKIWGWFISQEKLPFRPTSLELCLIDQLL
jgi:hypothetical protein